MSKKSKASKSVISKFGAQGDSQNSSIADRSNDASTMKLVTLDTDLNDQRRSSFMQKTKKL